MDITYYGHSCFRIRSRAGSIVTDPFQASIGYALPRISADICTISHDHPGHNNAGILRGDPYVITGPGEYEIRGIFVSGWPSYHDRKKGKERGGNTIYTFEVDGITIAHVGDLGHSPNQATVEMLGDVDILLIPVGGRVTLTAAMASEVINLIEPRLVIPMHYRTRAYAGGTRLDPVSKFLKEMGVHNGTAGDTLRVSQSSLPAETEVMVLKYKGQTDAEIE
jgi:L-ascorbate metabolism protein UlaG (beta-lactamase superfamily)